MKSPELEALISFLHEAQKDLANKDYEGLKISLTQALGRAKNLRTQFERNFYVVRKEAHE